MASLDAEPRQCEVSPGERSDGRDSAQKTRFCIRSPIGGGAKRETKAGNGSCRVPKTASLEQVTDLMLDLEQQDVCNMQADLAEVTWQESDAAVWNTLAHELETVIDCLPAEEEDVEDTEMPSDERRDESESEEQAPMEDEEQRDGSVAEHEGHSKQDQERVKKALIKLHTNLGHPGVEGKWSVC